MRRLLCAALLCVVLGCETHHTTPPEDATAPARVEDLSVESARGHGVTLAWTAPGDDGDEGQASRYSVRYSTVPITAAGWDTAEVVASPPDPLPAGERDELVITELADGTWYFALKAADELWNWSPLSNVVMATLVPDPDSTPPRDVHDLAPLSATSSAVTLGWTAPGDDGDEGWASAYDLRHALAPITEKTWADAVRVDGMPPPDTSSTSETFDVTGLDAETAYYFALKVADEVPNWSALSNVASIETPADTTPPAAVTDLAIASASTNSVTLSWTAPGDDADEGRASAYDVRRALTTITDETWDDATRVEGEPVPLPAGSPESFTVTGLDPETTYYFALRTADDVPSWSALSNVSGGADTTPPARVTSLTAFSSGPTGVTLRWTEPGDDGAEGRASAYDIRYAPVPITDETWDAATPASQAPAPSAPGTRTFLSVMGLEVHATYYFALRTADEVPNWSALSNVVSKATVSPARLTSSPGTTRPLYPVWSPDGRRIAVQADWGSTSWQIWVLPAAGGDPTRLTTDENFAWYPSWSPDGERIAFMTHRWEADAPWYDERRSGLWVHAAIPYAEPVLLAQHGNGEFVSSSSWSPDGSRVAYGVSHEFEPPDPAPHDIRIVPSIGGPSEVFATGGSTSRRAGHPMAPGSPSRPLAAGIVTSGWRRSAEVRLCS